MKNALTVIIALLLAAVLCGCAGGVFDDMPDGDPSSSPYSEASSVSETTEKVEWNRLYYANKRTKKFHYSNCAAAATINDENLYITEFRDELVNEGYIPCSVCNP